MSASPIEERELTLVITKAMKDSPQTVLHYLFGGPLVMLSTNHIVHGSMEPPLELHLNPQPLATSNVNQFTSFLSKKRIIHMLCKEGDMLHLHLQDLLTRYDLNNVIGLIPSTHMSDMSLLRLILENDIYQRELLNACEHSYESTVTTAVYDALVFDAYRSANNVDIHYISLADQSVCNWLPVLYMIRSQCQFNLSNDSRPDHALIFRTARLSLTLSICEAKMNINENEENHDKAFGEAVDALRSLIMAARYLSIRKGSERLTRDGKLALNRCAKGLFVIPFVTCHKYDVVIYCAGVKDTCLSRLSDNNSMESITEICNLEQVFYRETVKMFDLSHPKELISCAAAIRNLTDYVVERIAPHLWASEINGVDFKSFYSFGNANS